MIFTWIVITDRNNEVRYKSLYAWINQAGALIFSNNRDEYTAHAAIAPGCWRHYRMEEPPAIQ